MTSGTGIRVTLVGHCGADAAAIRDMVERAAPHADVVTINDENTLAAEMQRSRLLLINRILDGGFAEENGIELILKLAKGSSNAGADNRADKSPKLMLVSDQPDAQTQAEAAGAVSGFGKQDLAPHGATEQRLRELLT